MGVEPPLWTLQKGGRKRLSGSHSLLGGRSEELGLVHPSLHLVELQLPIDCLFHLAVFS